MRRTDRARIARLALVLSSALCVLHAQPPGRKEYTFRGRVEQVDVGAKRLMVANEPIEGWMGAMSMAFRVGNEEILPTLKPGDQITAKVYDGDFTLYNVAPVPQSNPSTPLQAKAPGLTLEQLEQIALASNPTAAQVQANLRAASALARQAGLYPNPTVGYYGDEIRGGSSNGGKQGGFVSQTIVLGGKLGAARRVAELQANQMQTGAEIQRLRIVNDVRTLFYEVLVAQRLVEVRRNLAKLAGDTIQTSSQLANVGQADRPDVLQAELEQQLAIVGLRVSQQNLQASWRILAAVVGKPEMPLARLEADLETIPDLNYEEWVATTLRESPEIKLAQQALARAEASLVQARKAPIPDLEVTGLLIQNNAPIDGMRKPIGVEAGAQIGVQIPLFNRNKGNIAAARAEIESAQQDLIRIKLQLQRDVARMFRDYDAARLLVRQYNTEMLPRAEQAFRLYQTNYQRMAGAYPQVLISQRTLFQLEAEYVQALGSAWQTAIVIRGFRQMDGLSEPKSPAIGAVQSSMGGYNSHASVAQ
ncbi:MAG TPA: TolC family protein [Bryobacteraceae bacterium]|nr:TolC family protein [Bryobacteraceae bacterium]